MHATHSVVQLSGGTVLVIVHSVGVELEAFLRGIDGDRHGTHGGRRLHQLLLVVLRNIHEADVIGAGVFGVVSVLQKSVTRLLLFVRSFIKPKYNVACHLGIELRTTNSLCALITCVVKARMPEFVFHKPLL